MKKLRLLLLLLIIPAFVNAQPFQRAQENKGNYNVYGGVWVNKLFYLHNFQDSTKLGNLMFAVINPANGMIDTVSLKSIRDSLDSDTSGSCLWMYTSTTLHPKDTAKNVAIGSNNARGNIFRVDRGNVLFGNYNPSAVLDSMFYWNAGKSAIRAGISLDSRWIEDSTGRFSAAFNAGLAYGQGSFAVNGGQSYGSYSMSGGESGKAYGTNCFAYGLNAIATDNSAAFGNTSKALGAWSFAVNSSQALGGNAFASGASVAHSDQSAAFNSSNAYGQYSLSANKATAKGYCQTVFGIENDTTGSGSVTFQDSTKSIFQIGCGWPSYVKRNAINITGRGEVSFLHYKFPIYDGTTGQVLTTNGAGQLSWATASGGASTDSIPFTRGSDIIRAKTSGSLLISGTTGNTPTSGAGTRLMYIPAKGGAFRVGVSIGTEWDDSNIGISSFVCGGFGNIASGIFSASIAGRVNLASGPGSVTIGEGNQAIGGYNIMIGYSNQSINANYHQCGIGRYNILQAYGDDVLAIGTYNTVNADECITVGHNLLGTTYHAIFFGRYNVGGGSRYEWISNEYLMAVGNGTGTGANANNAFAMLKDGTTYIGDRDNATDPIMTVNTTDSTTTLRGVLKLVPQASPPASPSEGMIYADTDHHLYYYDGSAWKQLDN